MTCGNIILGQSLQACSVKQRFATNSSPYNYIQEIATSCPGYKSVWGRYDVWSDR
jgi:hypothetical protein